MAAPARHGIFRLRAGKWVPHWVNIGEDAARRECALLGDGFKVFVRKG